MRRSGAPSLAACCAPLRPLWSLCLPSSVCFTGGAIPLSLKDTPRATLNQFQDELREKPMTSSEENVTTTPEPEKIEARPVQPSPDEFHPHLGPGRRTGIILAAAAFAALTLLIYSGIHSRAAAESRLK